MNIEFINKKLISINTSVLILPVFEEEKLSGQVVEIDKKLGGLVASIMDDGYFTPSLANVHVIYTHDKIKVKKIVLVGLGKKDKIDDEAYYRAYSAAASYVGKTRAKNCTIFVGSQPLHLLQNIVETILLSLYRFHHHKSKQEKKYLEKITFIVDEKYSQGQLKNIANKALIIAEGIYKARDLANHPSNFITPKKLAAEAKKLAKNKAISVKIVGEKEMTRLGMGLLLSVSMGSDEEAQLIVMDYKPKKYKQTIAFIGKGLTFDSGGLSLKPTQPVDAMIGMNMDMSGAAAVIGAFEAITKIKPKNIRIIGVIPATENMVSGRAQKPGDIWKSLDGKTVEVLNTDAEGRLVLADAITFVQKNYRPDYIIDLATLTGACMIALGHEYAGLFGNNQKLIDNFVDNAKNSYEKVWPMPIADVYREEMKGDIADLKNIGNGREAGACTAAAFLQEFVDPKVAWVHLDIAGTAMLSKPLRAYELKGGTGVGVKTILEFIESVK